MARNARFSRPFVLLPWVVTAAIAVQGQPALAGFAAGVQTGAIQSPSVTEASGIAASRRNPGVLWTHNDSGDSARVFAMTPQGANLGTFNLTGAGATDWEDIAVGPGPTSGQWYLYLADIGDNNAVRSSIKVYRVAEPAVSTIQTPVDVNLSGVESFTFTYPDGARDAETLMVDANGDLYVVSKRETPSRVYQAPAASLVNGVNTALAFKATLPWGWAVGGDISPDGDEVIVRGYFNASVWDRSAGSNLWDAFAGTAQSVPLVVEPQGEAVGFDRNGLGYYTTTEGAGAAISYYARNPAPIPGDADTDGDVDLSDLSLLASRWQATGNWNVGDFNDDGQVNLNDLSLLAGHWQEGVSPSDTIRFGEAMEQVGLGGVGIPEPAAILLLGAGHLAVVARAHQRRRVT